MGLHTILITGATGFLGSALCVDLGRSHQVVGLFRRQPPPSLRAAAPHVIWEQGDVADRDCLDCIFRQRARAGQAIDYVIHFAAFTDFGEKWQDEYSDTNVIGTRNIIESACDAGVKRILFAGSIAALEPLPNSGVLTEASSGYAGIAYSKSKALGEQMLIKHSHRVPVVILRLGGVFTDWCELPPLFSLINIWQHPLLGKAIPGRGLSGFPYIHRKDVVRIVRKVIMQDRHLGTCEVLFAAHPGCTTQKELFPVIRQAFGPGFSDRPMNTPIALSRAVLHAKFFFNTLLGKNTYERPWMVRYADRPLVVDTAHTQRKLNFKPGKKRHILSRLPRITRIFRDNRTAWYQRNINRNEQRYEYRPDR